MSDCTKGKRQDGQSGKYMISAEDQLSLCFCASFSPFRLSFLLSHPLAFCFCWRSVCILSFSPSLSLTLSLTPDSVECRSPCLEALLSLSLPHQSFIHSIVLCLSSLSPPLGLAISPGWVPVAGQLAWLDTAGLDMIYIAYGELQNLHNHKARLHLYPGMRAGDFHRFISSSMKVGTEHSQSSKGQLLQECFQRRAEPLASLPSKKRPLEHCMFARFQKSTT